MGLFSFLLEEEDDDELFCKTGDAVTLLLLLSDFFPDIVGVLLLFCLAGSDSMYFENDFLSNDCEDTTEFFGTESNFNPNSRN